MQPCRWAFLLVLVFALLAVMTPAAFAQAKPLLAIDLAKVAEDQIDGDAWVTLAEPGDRPCRIARGDRDAAVQAPAWWAGSLRPAEGEYFTIEIDYQDTATQPIRFLAWAGIGGNESRSELHRFGGLNDKKWKTAVVPVGWDMLMVRLGTRLVEFSIHSRQGDVPVAAIRVLPLPAAQIPQAAERWNAETREWIARAYQRHAGQILKEFEPPQKPAESVLKGGDTIVPFVRSYMSTVYPYSAPQDGEVGVPLKAQMALDEYEPAAFGVYAPKGDLTNVTVKVEELRHASNPKASLAVEVRTAEYALAQNGGKFARFPMRLWPMYPARIAKGESGWFWMTFHSNPTATAPGLYRGKVVIAADQGRAELDLAVRVLPFKLVAMNETDLRMGGCITGMVSRHEMDAMLRYNHNQLQYWFSGVRPHFVVKGKGDFDLDFSVLDDQFEQARKAGIQSNVWFLGGNPYGFPSTQTLPRELARQVLGMTMDEYTALMMKDPYNVPEPLVPLYKKWVAKVQQHARQKNWPEQILTPFDEPDKWRQRREGTGPWIRPQFEQCCRLIHEADPQTRVYGSMHHAPATLFLPVVDIFCTNAVHEDPLLGDKTRQAGKTFWQYSGGDQASPADRARYTFGFYFHSFGSRGSLCWAYNWFNDRFDTTEGSNWGYAWYSPLDVIPAPYYEGLREGWDDRRYIETLKKVAKEKGVAVSELLDEVGKIARASRGRGGEDTVNDFWDQAKQVGVMDDLRTRIAERIVEIIAEAPATRPADRAAR